MYSTYIIDMKPIQIMMDEELLARLDEDEEVRRLGRSAVFRKITEEYLDYRQRKDISRRYRQAYADEESALGEEWSGWEDQGIWPSE
jgi:metal-responsive CopG/Arc/MetJ family transcriptional regulator